MDRREWLTTLAVAVGVAGITVAVFTPHQANARGPLEGSRPKITVATATYQGCTVSIKRAAKPQSGLAELTLECKNPTSRMVDFPATLSWSEVTVQLAISRVALPTPPKQNTLRPVNNRASRALKVADQQKLRCIVFPKSTASYGINLPKSDRARKQGMVQLVVRFGDKVLMSPMVATK